MITYSELCAVAEPQPYFAELPDLRRETKNTLQKLRDIVTIVRCEGLISPTVESIKSTTDPITTAKAMPESPAGTAAWHDKDRGNYPLWRPSTPTIRRTPSAADAPKGL